MQLDVYLPRKVCIVLQYLCFLKRFLDRLKPVLKVWVATQTWVAKGRKMGGAKVIQICQN